MEVRLIRGRQTRHIKRWKSLEGGGKEKRERERERWWIKRVRQREIGRHAEKGKFMYVVKNVWKESGIRRGGMREREGGGGVPIRWMRNKIQINWETDRKMTFNYGERG